MSYRICKLSIRFFKSSSIFCHFLSFSVTAFLSHFQPKFALGRCYRVSLMLYLLFELSYHYLLACSYLVFLNLSSTSFLRSHLWQHFGVKRTRSVNVGLMLFTLLSFHFLFLKQIFSCVAVICLKFIIG